MSFYRGNFVKVGGYHYTWNFGKYDTPAERQEVDLYDRICKIV